MKATKVLDNIYWVGAQNPDLRIFDVIMTTRWGTSYNSYIVKGESRTAVIDGVKEHFYEEQESRINDVCDVSALDYIVCNHTEPDHAGSVARLLQAAPQATVVATRPALTLLKDITNMSFHSIEAKDGLTIDLGGLTLQFVMAPFLHWPDSMFTYVPERRFLSSGDVFGFHFAAKDVFDDLTPLDADMVESQKYYYDVIMSPFSSYVTKAIEKIKDMPLDVIGPSHGPVLRSGAADAVDRYARWAQEGQPQKRLFVGYVSCYGYTAQLARRICDVARQLGVEVVLADIAEIGVQKAVEEIMASSAFALGSPTLNRDALKPVWDVATSLCALRTKGKAAGVFGSYGWSGEAGKFLEQRLQSIGAKVVGVATARLKPSDEELARAEDLARKLVDAMR